MSNNELIGKTVEITIAKLTNSTILPTEDGGKAVATFMQVIYDKLSDLNAKEH
jgi:hypothetical protein